MKNPIRRNRNIGTAKQGHGQNNKLTIPQPCGILKSFYERLENYNKIKKVINGHEFLFIIQETRQNSKHACSVTDIETIIQYVPKEDYGDLKFIVLRQPTRKEETLSPTWGRLIYSYEFEGELFPAIILEAVDYSKQLKWPIKLSLQNQKELKRLKEDGHEILNNGRNYIACYEMEKVRNTQLYRTLLHEFGHYVHYLALVEKPGGEGESIEAWEARNDRYFKLPKEEREKFAHKYATDLQRELLKKNVIPFKHKC